MTLNIIPSTTPIPVENINVLFYGIPGIGKTSLTSSIPNSLLLDFDLGSHRSSFRGEVVRIKKWTEVSHLSEADLAPFTTIILDTVGRGLDQLSMQLMTENPKLRTANGSLTLQGWGELKSAFIAWMAKLRLMGKDVVMVAHDKEEKRNDLTVVRADIQGGSYAEIFKLADSVAWYGPGGEFGHGLLDFNPTAEHSGKNPGHIEIINVPDLHQQPHFLGTVMVQIKDRLNEIGERGRAIAAAVDEHRAGVDEAKTMKRINELATESNEIEERAVMMQVKHLINNRAKFLGLMYDKEKKAFVKNPDVKTEAEEPATSDAA